MRYKVWLYVEEVDDEADHYEDVGGPICIADTDTYAESHRIMRTLATLLDTGGNEDYVYPLEDIKPTDFKDTRSLDDYPTDGEGQSHIGR